ncbi:MAG: RNA 3'-phosphate cyclase, partial [Candidatus Zixiibacteriota bacterium]
MIKIDGSFGEGGGQILRTSLALSLVTGKAFHINNIRAGRRKPGLMRQHLTAVKAAMMIGRAEVKGDSIGSMELFFGPKEIRPGEYNFVIGTAGSCPLVLQTILPALITADKKSRLILEGGTHNPFAPPFDFLLKAFLPVINKMGPGVNAVLERPGFYPAGGGILRLLVEPSGSLNPVEIMERGEIKRRFATAYVAGLPVKIGERELKIVAQRLSWGSDCLRVKELSGS